MEMKTFNISLPAEIVELIDTQAKLCYETRSSYIKHILIKALRNAGAFELQTIDNPEKLSRAFRTQKLKAYLENLELTNDDLRN